MLEQLCYTFLHVLNVSRRQKRLKAFQTAITFAKNALLIRIFVMHISNYMTLGIVIYVLVKSVCVILSKEKQRHAEDLK